MTARKFFLESEIMATKKIFERLKAKSLAGSVNDGLSDISTLGPLSGTNSASSASSVGVDCADPVGSQSVSQSIDGNTQSLAHPNIAATPQDPPPCSLCSGKKFWRSIADRYTVEPTWRCIRCCVPPSPRFVAEIFEIGIDQPTEKNAPLPPGGMVQGRGGAADRGTADQGSADREVIVSSQQVACEVPVCSVCHSTWAIERTTKLVDSESREETVQQVTVRCWSCSSAIPLETFNRACFERVGFNGDRKLMLDEIKQRARLMSQARRIES
jgi:hypothetical protein